jgi:hypothetical protein
MKNLDIILEKMYNTLGNSYLTKNFDTEPFEFKVNVRKGTYDNDLQDYIVEVYSNPDLPKSFIYKSDSDENSDEKYGIGGIDISVLRGLFKEYVNYVDSSFGSFGKTVGVKFMNVK